MKAGHKKLKTPPSFNLSVLCG